MATLTTPTLFPILGNSITDQLAARLRATTTAEVRFTPADRALYASDLSHYRQVPVGVVIRRTPDDVIATVAACREFDVPLFGRGAGTSLSGQTTNAAVVLDFSKYLNGIEELNPKKRYASVQPGLINDGLRSAAEKHNLTFAPDPATHEYCTLGGMIGNNTCGPHSVLGGFLEQMGYKPRSLAHLTTRAIVHGHCNHKALWSMSPEERLLQSAGLKPDVLDSGCCGLAGSFGYEASHHDISMAIGNQVLLPKLRAATSDTLLIADGFSCRQQIAHGTPRQALHTAEVLALGLQDRGAGKPSKKRPIETGHTQPKASKPFLPLLAAGVLATAVYLFTRNRPER